MEARSARITLLIAAALLAAGAARARDISKGKEIAQVWCSSCHRVDPEERKTARDAAPAFSAVARMKSTTETSLAAFLSTPHGRMPDLILSREEIAERLRLYPQLTQIDAAAVVLPFRLQTEHGVVSLFSTVTAFGTPINITVAETALQCFAPMGLLSRC